MRILSTKTINYLSPIEKFVLITNQPQMYVAFLCSRVMLCLALELLTEKKEILNIIRHFEVGVQDCHKEANDFVTKQMKKTVHTLRLFIPENSQTGPLKTAE